MTNNERPRVYGFDGPHAFLSNFFESPIVVEDLTYRTVEHAFQALKTLDPAMRLAVRDEPTPGRAKRAGRRLALRPDWEAVKTSVMLTCLRAKFTNGELRWKLVATGEMELIEANGWGDRYWGVDRATGVGENRLGHALMTHRVEVQVGNFPVPAPAACSLPRCRMDDMHASFCAHAEPFAQRCVHCDEHIYISSYAGGWYHWDTKRERCAAKPDCFAKPAVGLAA